MLHSERNTVTIIDKLKINVCTYHNSEIARVISEKDFVSNVLF